MKYKYNGNERLRITSEGKSVVIEKNDEVILNDKEIYQIKGNNHFEEIKEITKKSKKKIMEDE